jgi:hypothetical protein
MKLSTFPNLPKNRNCTFLQNAVTAGLGAFEERHNFPMPYGEKVLI